MFDAFIIAGQAAGWSTATVRQYRKHLTYWHHYQGDNPVTAATLQLWLIDIRARWEPATVRAAVIAVRGYLRYIGRADLADAMRVPSQPPRVQRTLNAKEIDRLLEVAAIPPEKGLSREDAAIVAIRNPAIIALLFDAWLRAGELCRLSVYAVSVDARRLIVDGKGDREELVAFSAATAMRLAAWLNVRKAVAQPGTTAFFVSIGGNTPGRPLTKEGLQRILKVTGDRAGIDGVCPHAFRRGGATEAIRNGAPTRWVQAHGRWRKLDMVERYTLALQTGDQIERWSSMRSLRNHGPDTSQADELDV